MGATREAFGFFLIFVFLCLFVAEQNSTPNGARLGNSTQSFDEILAWLNPDRDVAGTIYVQLRAGPHKNIYLEPLPRS